MQEAMTRPLSTVARELREMVRVERMPYGYNRVLIGMADFYAGRNSMIEVDTLAALLAELDAALAAEAAQPSEPDLRAAATDLLRFIGKTASDGRDTGLCITADDLHAEGLTERLQRLQDAVDATLQPSAQQAAISSLGAGALAEAILAKLPASPQPAQPSGQANQGTSYPDLLPIDDPTPWCHVCGARLREQCQCGPIAENE